MTIPKDQKIISLNAHNLLYERKRSVHEPHTSHSTKETPLSRINEINFIIIHFNVKGGSCVQ